MFLAQSFREEDARPQFLQAVQQGNLELVRKLYGTRNSEFLDDATAAYEAVRHKQLGVLQFLFVANADIHDSNDGLLVEATKRGFSDITGWLLSHGANPFAHRADCFFQAIQNNRNKIVRKLVQFFPRIVHENDDQALWLATIQNNAEIVQTLLGKMQRMFSTFSVCLQYALDNSFYPTVQVLISKYLYYYDDANAMNIMADEDIFKYAVQTENKKLAELVMKQRNVHLPQVLLDEALYFVVSSDWTEAFPEQFADLLLRHGADIHSRNDEMLQRAVERGDEEAVIFLLEHGISASTNNHQAILQAAQSGFSNIFDRLFERYDEDVLQALVDSSPALRNYIERRRGGGADMDMGMEWDESTEKQNSSMNEDAESTDVESSPESTFSSRKKLRFVLGTPSPLSITSSSSSSSSSPSPLRSPTNTSPPVGPTNTPLSAGPTNTPPPAGLPPALSPPPLRLEAASSPESVWSIVRTHAIFEGIPQVQAVLHFHPSMIFHIRQLDMHVLDNLQKVGMLSISGADAVRITKMDNYTIQEDQTDERFRLHATGSIKLPNTDSGLPVQDVILVIQQAAKGRPSLPNRTEFLVEAANRKAMKRTEDVLHLIRNPPTSSQQSSSFSPPLVVKDAFVQFSWKGMVKNGMSIIATIYTVTLSQGKIELRPLIKVVAQKRRREIRNIQLL